MYKKLNKFLYLLPILILFFLYSTLLNKNNFNLKSKIIFANYTNYNEEILSEFTTTFNAKNLPRVNNIKLSSISIDQYIVQPGETFSYNNVVGPTTKEYGYKISKIFRDGKEFKGYGGGSCQVSTTLFNAAELAGLKITERHKHSKKVDYVLEGKDATTSYGGVDLKFINTFPFPIKINSYMSNGSISVQILKI